MKKPAKRYVEGARMKERAQFWCVELRTMQRLIQRGVPVDDVAGTIKWYSVLSAASQGKLTADFRRRLLELRVELEKKEPTGAPQDPDYSAFKDHYSETAQENANLRDLKRQRAFYLFKLEQAQKRNDSAAAYEATKQFTHFANVIHDAELRDQKLGRDIGNLYSGEEIDRIFRAIAYWQLRCIDETMSEMCAQVSAASGGSLTRHDVKRVVEPLLLAARLLAPLTKATKINAGVQIPPRFVAAMKAATASVLEDGEKEFAALYAEPVVLCASVV